MAVWGMLAPSYPLFLVIVVVVQNLEALVLQDQSPSSLDSPQIIARAKQPVTLEPYTGNGAPPVAKIWNLLSVDQPLHYTPTASNITVQLTIKDYNSQNINPSNIYSLTVLSMADIATATATTNGNGYIRRYGSNNSTFATSYAPSHIHFLMTAADHLPIHVVMDVLRAMQELTHYLLFLELVFEVFSDTDPTSPLIASGCLALHCGSQDGTVQSRDLEYANFSATNITAAPSRRLQSSIAPIKLTKLTELESVAVSYAALKDASVIHEQSFADVADRILANITDLIIANKGDGLLPFYGTSKRRLFHYEDTWGSNLGISLLPSNLPGFNFTLGQAAMALKVTQNNMSSGPMVESSLEITVDGSMVGWGCLMYTDTSAWRCLMPTAGSSSGVGSQSISGAANEIPDINTLS